MITFLPKASDNLSPTMRDSAVVLPEVISKEPLGPAVRQGDDQWFDIVRWTLLAMIDAEDLGISSANIDDLANSDRADIRDFLANESGPRLQLSRDWAANIIRMVGNYEEVFERNVGSRSRLAIPRGLNKLWKNGGIQYAPPLR